MTGSLGPVCKSLHLSLQNVIYGAGVNRKIVKLELKMKSCSAIGLFAKAMRVCVKSPKNV